METILIQIASYKDPELPKTIKDAIEKSAYPERLRFAICWQRTEEESLGSYLSDPRFRVHQMHWSEAKGVGFARHICNSLYTYEDYTLQIDSHHRFAKDWDVKLIEQWKSCKHPKAVLSGYPPGYEYSPDGKEVFANFPPMTMICKGFDYGFVPTFKSWHFHPKVNLRKPARGCFIAAGFMFTIGNVCEEVPYQKDVYFTGEEIIHTMRLFTHGYRVFYPHQWVIWHYYERKTFERHWENFTTNTSLKEKYDEIQKASTEAVHGILFGDPKYSNLFGKVNTIDDFERYVGINLKQRIIHPDQLRGLEPPYETVRGWENKVRPLKEFELNLMVNVDKIPDLDDYDFWYFGLHDKDCNELWRQDVKVEKTVFKKAPVQIKCNIMLREQPSKYIVWPHSASKGWLERLVYDLNTNEIKPV